MPARGGRRINRRKDWVPLSRFQDSHFYKSGGAAALPVFDEFTFSLWLRIQGNTDEDGTVLQWVWQEDLVNLVYWQIFRLRWVRTAEKLTVEVFDPIGYWHVMSFFHRPFSVPRGKLVHLHGYWHKSTGFVGTQNGVEETTTPGATTANDIEGFYSGWQGVGGGQVLSGVALNQVDGDIGPTWVGFNQNRPVTDFYLNDRPVPLPEDGNLGTGVPEFYFNGYPDNMNGKAGFSRVDIWKPCQRATP